MLTLSYKKRIPYPFETVLSQYFDYEHIEHVHPRTLGRYELIENRGDVIVYEQHWPKDWLGRWRTSRVEHRWLPPNEMWFDFVEGLHQGIRVHTLLHRIDPEPMSGEQTDVEETYHLPYPDHPLLKVLILPPMMRTINRIWDEDLKVDVCIGGWPGVPSTERVVSGNTQVPPVTVERDLGPAGSTGLGLFNFDGVDVWVRRVGAEYQAFEAVCPHTGGPLWLGKLERERVTCPWHGACFRLSDGKRECGPMTRPLRLFRVEERDGRLMFLGERQ